MPDSLGASGRQRHRTSVAWEWWACRWSGEGRLTRQHRVLQGLLGHHVGKTAEDGLQGVAELHQVLGLPGQAVLLTAAGQGSPRGAERAWGERGQVGSLLSGLEGAPTVPDRQGQRPTHPRGGDRRTSLPMGSSGQRDRGPLTLMGEAGGPALPTGSSGQRDQGPLTLVEETGGPACPRAAQAAERVCSHMEHGAA